MKTYLLALAAFSLCGVLWSATFTVTEPLVSGAGSLRQAILDANGTTGDGIISFAFTGTITLASALPSIIDNVTITGPGSNLLTISGNNSVQVFAMNSGTVNVLSDLIVANGRATGNANGAAIANAGTLTVSDCVFIGNQAFGGFGGAIYNVGNLTGERTLFVSNKVVGANGQRGSGTAALLPAVVAVGLVWVLGFLCRVETRV